MSGFSSGKWRGGGRRVAAFGLACGAFFLAACADGRVQFIRPVAPVNTLDTAVAITATNLPAPSAGVAAGSPADVQFVAPTAPAAAPGPQLSAPLPTQPATTFRAELRASAGAAHGQAVWQKRGENWQLDVTAASLPGLLASEEWVVYGFTAEPYAAVRLGALATDPVSQQITFARAFGAAEVRPERIVVKSQPVGSARFAAGATALEGVFSPQN